MLETIWFVLWTLLWAVYFVLDGFDLGLGTLLPFLGKTEEERRIMYNAAGPFWDGNEVWLISAGGVTFAAFPKAYAVMFSALYALVVFLILTAFYTKLYDNYLAMPALFILPLLALAGLLGARCMLKHGKLWLAWGCSALFILGVTFFGVMGMFPGMIISSLDPAATVTAFNGSSSPLTLKIMLGVALVMVPIVLVYQFWAYRLFSQPVTAKDLDDHAY